MKRINCSASELLPLLGGLHCKSGLLLGFALLRRDVSIDVDTFNKEALDTLIAEGKFIGVVDYSNAEDNNQDPQYSSTTLQERSQNIGGIKGWRFIFSKGNCFQNELNKLNNSEMWTFIPVLEGGKWVMDLASDGTARGFDAKLFVGMFNAPLTADVAGSTLEVDLTYAGSQRWQSNASVLEPIDFDGMAVKPIAGLNIDIATALVDGGTVTAVGVSGLCSGADVTGLIDATNWKVNVDGVDGAVTVVAYNPTTKQYSLTHAALDAGQAVYFKTSKNGSDIYVLDSNYYSGRSLTETVS